MPDVVYGPGLVGFRERDDLDARAVRGVRVIQ